MSVTEHISMERRPALRALGARLGQAWPHRRVTGPPSIWVLNVLMVLAAGALLHADRGDDRPVLASVHLPLWALLLAFAAAERFVVHVHFRHSAHSMSLAEIPLVFGLLFSTGQDVILAAAIGRVLVLALHRRLPPIRLAFNLGAFLLWAAV